MRHIAAGLVGGGNSHWPATSQHGMMPACGGHLAAGMKNFAHHALWVIWPFRGDRRIAPPQLFGIPMLQGQREYPAMEVLCQPVLPKGTNSPHTTMRQLLTCRPPIWVLEKGGEWRKGFSGELTKGGRLRFLHGASQLRICQPCGWQAVGEQIGSLHKEI